MEGSDAAAAKAIEADEPPLIREIAARVVFGLGEEDTYVEDEEDAALMDAMHRQWPEATDEEITRGFNLALAVAEKVKTHGGKRGQFTVCACRNA